MTNEIPPVSMWQRSCGTVLRCRTDARKNQTHEIANCKWDDVLAYAVGTHAVIGVEAHRIGEKDRAIKMLGTP